MGNSPDVPEGDVLDGYSGSMIDLSALKQAVRRRRKLWIGTGLVGLIIGGAFHLFVPAKYSAVTNVYMVEPADSNPTQAIANDVSLLGTRVVAEEALSALHLHVNPVNFIPTYVGTAPSNVILSIKLSATTPAKAVAYDNAVAKAFLSVRSNELAQENQLVVNGLEAQVKSLDGEMNSLTNEISALSESKPGSQSADQVATLVGQRTNAEAQITALQSQEQQDVYGEESVTAGSHVLDPAAALTISDKKVIAEDGLTGLIGGLGVGLGIVIVGAVISDRPRRRYEVASALGVPVELSVGKYRAPLVLREPRMRRSVKRPGTTLQMIERRLRNQLEAAPSPALATLAIGPVEPAALGVASLALTLAFEGKRVVVVDLADGRPLASLFRAKGIQGSPVNVVFEGQLLTLIVAPDDPGALAGIRSRRRRRGACPGEREPGSGRRSPGDVGSKCCGRRYGRKGNRHAPRFFHRNCS